MDNKNSKNATPEDVRQSINELLRTKQAVTIDLPNWALRLVKVLKINDGDLVLIRYDNQAVNQSHVASLGQYLQSAYPDIAFTVLGVLNLDDVQTLDKDQMRYFGLKRVKEHTQDDILSELSNRSRGIIEDLPTDQLEYLLNELIEVLS